MMTSITCLFLTAVHVGLLVGQAEKAGKPSQDLSGSRNLELALSSSRTTLALYEPLVLTYSVKNPTNAPIYSKVDMAYHSGTLRIWIKDESSEAVEFFTGIIASTGHSPPELHPPKSTRAGNTIVFFNNINRSLAFPRTGRYTLTGKMHVGNDPDPIVLESEPLTIDIVEPGREDEALIRDFGSHEKLIALLKHSARYYCLDDGGPDCVAEITRLVRDHMGSAYAPEILLGLAHEAGSGPRGEPGNERLEIDMYTEILTRWPSHPLVVYSMSGLINAHARAGRKSEAMRWIDRYEKEFPGRDDSVRFYRRLAEGKP